MYQYSIGSQGPRASHPFRTAIKAGFTLIELLVVVLIIGILSAVALPQYQRAVEKSRAAEAMTVLRSIAQANTAYRLANGSYALDMSQLDIEIPGEEDLYNGMERRLGKRFQFGAKADCCANSVAIAQRVSFGGRYALFILDDTPGFLCETYSAQGEDLCKTLSGGRRKGGYYWITP